MTDFSQRESLLSLPQVEQHPLSLHVPDCSMRPERARDYSHLNLSGAGTVARPAVTAELPEIRDLANSLIRVLDDDGQAVGPWVPQRDPQQLRQGLRAML